MGKRANRNAWLKSICRPGLPPAPHRIGERKPRTKSTREAWVIKVVARIVGTKVGAGFVLSDDVASDIILKLLDAGGFLWEEEEIEAFCRREASYVLRRYTSRRERNECEFSNAEGEPVKIEHIAGTTPAMQEINYDAGVALAAMRCLPHNQRRALEILCGGGNPINVAEEMSLPPWRAILLIKEARRNIAFVDLETVVAA